MYVCIMYIEKIKPCKGGNTNGGNNKKKRTNTGKIKRYRHVKGEMIANWREKKTIASVRTKCACVYFLDE